MKAFQIISKLTPMQSQRLRRVARQYYDEGTSTDHPLPQGAFVRIGRNLYTALDNTVNIHQVAQHAMTVAGRTFDYQVIETERR